MSEKLPDGWFVINDEAWNRSDRASAVVRCYGHDDWRGMVYGPPRMTQEEAEQDRVNLIAGLEGRAGHISVIEAERDAVPQLLRDSMRVTPEEIARLKADMARKDAEIASLRQRVAASEAYAQHLLAALNAVSGFKGPH